MSRRLPLVRPKTRGDCAEGVRPCPWVTCRYNLQVEVTTGGHLRQYRGMETCALDVADRGGATLEQIGEAIGVSRQAVQEVERKVLERLSDSPTLSSPSPDPPAWRWKGKTNEYGT